MVMLSGFLRTPLLLGLVGAIVLFSSCQTRSPEPDFNLLLAHVFIEDNAAMPHSRINNVIMPMSRTHIPIRNRFIFAPWDIVQVGQVNTEEWGPAVVLVLSQAAGQDLFRISSGNLGRRLVLKINGVPIGSRPIDGIMDQGMLSFFVEIDDDEVPELVENLSRTAVHIQRERGRQQQ